MLAMKLNLNQQDPQYKIHEDQQMALPTHPRWGDPGALALAQKSRLLKPKVCPALIVCIDCIFKTSGYPKAWHKF